MNPKFNQLKSLKNEVIKIKANLERYNDKKCIKKKESAAPTWLLPVDIAGD